MFITDMGKTGKRIDLGAGLFLEIIEGNRPKGIFYRGNTRIKEIDLADKVGKRLFVVEAVDLGAKKSRLADALQMSRQSIHNHLEIRKHFGLEGLIHS